MLHATSADRTATEPTRTQHAAHVYTHTDQRCRRCDAVALLWRRDRHVGILSVDPVGSYAVRIVFDDLHRAGIYTWDYLYDLGSHKV